MARLYRQLHRERDADIERIWVGIHSWARRADAYDMYMDRREQQAAEDAVAENRRRALRTGSLALDLAERSFLRWLAVFEMDQGVAFKPDVAVRVGRFGMALGASRDAMTEETYKEWLEQLDFSGP